MMMTMMRRTAFAVRGARFMSAAAEAKPKVTIDRITGQLADFSLDGPRQRQDGSEFWIERYMVELEDGSLESCSRFLDNGSEAPLAKTGSAVSFKVRRRGEYADVVPEDYDSVIETVLPCKVVDIEREGPRVSAKGNEWYVDWYTVEADGTEHRIRKPVFESTEGHVCAVGDAVEFKVRQQGNFAADIVGIVTPEVEELQGTVSTIRRVGPKVGPSGKEYTLEFYVIETRPGVTRSMSRFVSNDEPALAEEGQSVIVVCKNTDRGYCNLVSLSVAA